MLQKQDTHIFQGLQTDNDLTKHIPEFFIDARNIRISNVDSSQIAIVSEKGTKAITVVGDENQKIEGIYLGHALLNEYLILFTTTSNGNSPDFIYKVDITSNRLSTLYNGNLNFNVKHSIKTLASYENDIVQKVYWIDNLNQPRLINIVASEETKKKWKDDSFNFVNELALEEDVNIDKVYSSSGLFHSGTIQYAFTYFNKYGQESNIAWISPIYYISFSNRAGSPDETIGNAFKISIKNPDANFEYIRLYSIHRSSIDSTPSVKLIVNLAVKEDADIEYTDNNTTGEIVDPTYLLYVGGDSIHCDSICQKDGTLFLGNITLDRPDSDVLKKKMSNIKTEVQIDTRTLEVHNSYYPDLNVLDSNKHLDNPRTFKKGEEYRLGVQFQYKTGKWSEPIALNNSKFTMTSHADLNGTTYKLPTFSTLLNLTEIRNLGYKKVRPLIVYPSMHERKVIAQGVLNPTVFNILHRKNHTPDAQASWFFRPYKPEGSTVSSIDVFSDEVKIQCKHMWSLFGGFTRRAEIQGVPTSLSNVNLNSSEFKTGNNYKDEITVSRNRYGGTYNTDDQGNITGIDRNSVSYREYTNVFKFTDLGNIYGVDQSIVTFNSPDIEQVPDFSLIDLNQYELKIVGRAIFGTTIGDIDIQVSSPTIANDATGFIHQSVNSKKGRLSSGLFFNDYLVNEHYVTRLEKYRYEPYDEEYSPVGFLVHPWQKSGSINNDCERPSDVGGTRTAVLKKKVISNYHETQTEYFSMDTSKGTLNIEIFNSDQIDIVKYKDSIYYGNVDTALFSPIAYGVVFAYDYDINYKDNSIFNFESTNFFAMDSNRQKLFFNFVQGTSYSSTSKRTPIKGGISTQIDCINDIGDENKNLRTTNETIRMRYKSSPHAVIHLDSHLTYDNYSNLDKGYLYIAELHKKDTDLSKDINEYQSKQEFWVPAGNAVPISNDGNTNVSWLWGDCFYQRYDCLKTYRFSETDINQVIEIGSFLLETRVNCEGRWDRNRGQYASLVANNVNYNLFNTAYNQIDNYFTYQVLDKDYYKIKEYKNSVTWSLEKLSGQDVDPWTKVTLANMLDLDGDKGELKALVNFNSTIYAFQEHGISNILFNSRAQIPVSDGTPIEISNNYKVEGKRYIADHLGLSYYKNLVSTPSGIYFIDNQSKDLYSVGGDLTNVSATHSMSGYFDSQNPDNLRLYYDFNNSYLYISNDIETLGFSEKLGQFVSFYDYQEAECMFNIKDSFYAITNFNEQKKSNITIHKIEAESSKYQTSIFGKPYTNSFSFISNRDPLNNKVFTNLNIRGDWYEKGKICDDSFATMKVTNEYQKGILNVENYHKRRSNSEKKLRIWRYDIPRNLNSRDRISNTWCRIDITSDRAFIIHDLDVIYYI